MLKEIALANEAFDENMKDILDFQYSPHHVAANYGKVLLCEYIIKKTGLVNPSHKKGFLPIHIAARLGHFDTVKFLANHLQNKNPRSNNGITVLHFATIKGDLKTQSSSVVWLLLSNPS